jgi:dihydrofolate reductase
MSALVYSAITSLDGYVADRRGRFDWATPDEEVHAFVNEAERGVGTYLYGRRMYDVMRFWESADEDPGLPPLEREYARIWRSADKVVYSRTVTDVTSARTRVERQFEPEALHRLKESVSHDISVGGPTLAAHALAAGLVDEIRLFLTPVVVGGGTRSLPDDLYLELELVEQHRFRNGVVHLRYRTRGSPAVGSAGD